MADDDGAPWLRQRGARVRLEWGPVAVAQVPADVVVIVDVLRFTTAVDVAVGRGATVFPYRWKDASAQRFAQTHGAVLADGTGPDAPSLSPQRLTSLSTGERIVLPSPNGATCAVLAAERGSRVLAACLRNASAVGQWLNAHAAGRSVLVVPCGERWPDGGLRPAVEDYLGAGAVAAALDGQRSAEAELAARAWAAGDAARLIRDSISGAEQVARGWAGDLELALRGDVSGAVPVLGDGAFSDACAGAGG